MQIHRGLEREHRALATGDNDRLELVYVYRRNRLCVLDKLRVLGRKYETRRDEITRAPAA